MDNIRSSADLYSLKKQVIIGIALHYAEISFCQWGQMDPFGTKEHRCQ